MTTLDPRHLTTFRSIFGGWLLKFLLTFLAAKMIASASWAVAKTHERWPACTGTSTLQQLSFVHVSDVHAQYNPETDGATPVGRIRGYYEAVKKENPYTVFTDGGDDYEKGSVAEEFSRGQSTRDVVKALAYDVRTLGNHDFAWGIEELMRFSDDPRAVVLSANSRLVGESGAALAKGKQGRQPWTDYAELQVGCVKIGFFGLTTRPYDSTGRQHDGPIYPEHPALESDYDHLSIARQIIKEHRQEVDLLVLVSHLGITDDILLAEGTDGIDLILGGHSHTVLDKAIQVKTTQIIHPGSNAEYIGRYDLQYDLKNRVIAESSYRLVENLPGVIAGSDRIDRAVADILHRYRPPLDETVAAVKKVHGRPEIAKIAALAAASRPGVDAAFVSPASVWQDNWRGGLTRQDLFDTFKVEREPVGTTGSSSLYLMRVKGADLLLARQVLRDFAYSGPEKIADCDFYTVAVQKAQALRQENFFGRPISLLPPQPAAELWETVAAFALDRGIHGLTLDGETLSIGDAPSLFAGAGERPYLPGDGRQPRS